MATEQKEKLTAGSFCWVDLASSDTAAAQKFYEDLFGWSAQIIEMGEGQSYTMFGCGDNETAGLLAMDAKQKAAGFPSYWTSYILVDDIVTSTAEAKKCGATVHMLPSPVGDVGIMSIIQDPTGAGFALWQDKSGKSERKTGVGHACWSELATEDTSGASDFYHKVFGWTKEAMPFGEMPYDVFKLNGESVAGMMTLSELAKSNGAPPHWLTYISVANCDQSLSKTKELSGKILMDAKDFEGVG